jgi:hypothetical protein
VVKPEAAAAATGPGARAALEAACGGVGRNRAALEEENEKKKSFLKSYVCLTQN